MSKLSQSIISHQIWLQRLATQTGSLSIPFVNKMREEVKDAVLRFGDDARTVKKLNKMLSSLDGVLSDVTADWKSTIGKSLRDISDYENKWFIHTLEDNTKEKTFIAGPTAEELWASVKFAPLALGSAPVGMIDMLDNWTVAEKNRLVRGVQSGFIQGQTTRQINSAVVGAGGLADISDRNAMTVVRTAVNHVSNTARNEVYSSNSDIVGEYEIIATLDSKTSPTCRGLDKQRYRVGKGPLPPFHPNCLLGDTVVSTGSRVSNVFKRAYKGIIVYVTTKSGRTLSITPNHQVMTAAGWVAAGELNVGIKLVCGNQDAVSFHHKEDNVVAEFADLFSALEVSSDSSSIGACPTSTEDFHGDGSNGEVEIILVDGLSWSKAKASLGKDASHGELPMTSGVDMALPGLRSANEFITAGLASRHGIVGGGSKSCPLGVSGIVHSDDHGLTTAPDADADFFEKAKNWTLRDADSLSDVCWAEASGVELDEVIDLRFGEADFCGHVYNLENETNWYLANGIIAHNCRTTTIPIIADDFLSFLDEGAVRTARGADGGTQVDADTSYYEFLSKQPAWFQDAAIGPVRGKILRNSGLSPDEFRSASIDGFGRPMTLKEMAEMDKRVADYLSSIGYTTNK